MSSLRPYVKHNASTAFPASTGSAIGLGIGINAVRPHPPRVAPSTIHS
ncbi:hypothetical protein BIFBIF_01529 [Bifidobacterium bifidum ATCC 29521 = JCM 1255 = DSM 20456]|nr:hypothetical protein BIFBIF_01529 [Bifidobacterium bifidum ATCC 29521 = JCM 1255 = DSM 20456]